MNEQLKALAKRVPSHWVKYKGKFKYVEHAIITQSILATLGPTSQKVDQIIYNGDTVTGVLLTMTFNIDGVTVEVTEAGDCEHPKEGKNGLNLQMAISSAYKRCCMRVGKCLQCWTDSDDFYILDKVLEDKEKVKDLRNEP